MTTDTQKHIHRDRGGFTSIYFTVRFGIVCFRAQGNALFKMTRTLFLKSNLASFKNNNCVYRHTSILLLNKLHSLGSI